MPPAAPNPIAVFSLSFPSAEPKAPLPTTTFFVPVVTKSPASFPMKTLLFPVVISFPA